MPRSCVCCAGVPRNLAVRFTEDSIDETGLLASTLQQGALGSSLDLTQLNLPGDHLRPLRCALVDSRVLA